MNLKYLLLGALALSGVSNANMPAEDQANATVITELPYTITEPGNYVLDVNVIPGDCKDKDTNNSFLVIDLTDSHLTEDPVNIDLKGVPLTHKDSDDCDIGIYAVNVRYLNVWNFTTNNVSAPIYPVDNYHHYYAPGYIHSKWVLTKARFINPAIFGARERELFIVQSFLLGRSDYIYGPGPRLVVEKGGLRIIDSTIEGYNIYVDDGYTNGNTDYLPSQVVRTNFLDSVINFDTKARLTPFFNAVIRNSKVSSPIHIHKGVVLTSQIADDTVITQNTIHDIRLPNSTVGITDCDGCIFEYDSEQYLPSNVANDSGKMDLYNKQRIYGNISIETSCHLDLTVGAGLMESGTDPVMFFGVSPVGRDTGLCQELWQDSSNVLQYYFDE